MSNKHDLPPECGPLIERLRDEADMCRNEGASDVAALLDEGASALIDLRAWCLLRIHDLEAENEALKRVVGAARAVADGPEDLGEDFLVPSHLMAPLSLALDELDAMTKEQKT